MARHRASNQTSQAAIISQAAVQPVLVDAICGVVDVLTQPKAQHPGKDMTYIAALQVNNS